MADKHERLESYMSCNVMFSCNTVFKGTTQAGKLLKMAPARHRVQTPGAAEILED
jgi:hypothetical protein